MAVLDLPERDWRGSSSTRTKQRSGIMAATLQRVEQFRLRATGARDHAVIDARAALAATGIGQTLCLQGTRVLAVKVMVYDRHAAAQSKLRQSDLGRTASIPRDSGSEAGAGPFGMPQVIQHSAGNATP